MSQLYDTPWSPATDYQLPFSPDSVYSPHSYSPRSPTRPVGPLTPLPEHPYGAYTELEGEGEVYRLVPVAEVDIGRVYRPERGGMLGESPRMSLENVGSFGLAHESTAALIASERELPPPPEDAFVVAITPDDTRHPFNWSPRKKWTVLCVVCSAAVCVTVASSIQASTYQNLEDEFDTPRIAAVAGVSLYVLGFGVGAGTSPPGALTQCSSAR